MQRDYKSANGILAHCTLLIISISLILTFISFLLFFKTTFICTNQHNSLSQSLFAISCRPEYTLSEINDCFFPVPPYRLEVTPV